MYHRVPIIAPQMSNAVTAHGDHELRTRKRGRRSWAGSPDDKRLAPVNPEAKAHFTRRLPTRPKKGRCGWSRALSRAGLCG